MFDGRVRFAWLHARNICVQDIAAAVLSNVRACHQTDDEVTERNRSDEVRTGDEESLPEHVRILNAFL